MRSSSTEKKGLFETVEDELKLRHYSRQTVKAYLGHLRRFIAYFHPRHPRDLTTQDMRTYLLFLIEGKGLSRASIDQTINARRFLYVELYHRKFVMKDIPRPKKEHRLPTLLSKGEILRIAQGLENPKHRLIIELMYASGLRVSEVVRLRVQDVNLNELTLFVRGGKGKKDRLTIVSERLKSPLSCQMEGKQANELVFPGPKGKTLTTCSVQKCFRLPLPLRGFVKTPPAIPSDIRLQPTFWKPAPTFVTFKSCWGIRGWKPRAFTRM